ncbi:Ca(2+)-dependent cysteine protease [Boothiomyces macroporosus]|uniref:Ca(2+)-dependent cysteine protease n=1 Tax=Boothiomyces macroporosus TaxID=261099 RepID=A0AAD5UCU1_9FUNG|nr:Ca(2+)-dependent cysteine protease [Boothiomyces macroporosus]
MLRGLGNLVNKLEKAVENVDPNQVEKMLGKVIGGDEATAGRKPTGNMASHEGTNGKRRALLIGINYTGTQSQLSGCINDVKNVHNFIKDQYSDIRILTDDQQGPNVPTKANIIESFKWLVSGAQPGDSFFLHYSGHGSTQKDEDGDEVDGLDNTICPLDYNTQGMIVDDDMNTILVQALPEGSRMVAIFDCCHSGTMLDLPFMYTIDGNLEVTCKSNKRAALEGGIKALKDFQKGDKQAAMKEAFSALSLLAKPEQNIPNSEAERKTLETKYSKADVLMFSGCKDNQTSADAKINGEGCGAMSWALLSVLDATRGQRLTLKDLLAKLREKLQGKYEQIPQMSTSHEVDVNNNYFALV